MRNRFLSRSIALLLALTLVVDPELLLAAEERKSDITGIDTLPISRGGSRSAASHLPAGFDDIATFHDGLVAETEGYFRIEYQDIAIPGRGPPLEVRRTYNSFVKRKTAFGKSWGWNWGVRLIREDEDTGEPVIIEPDNLRTHFAPEGDGFVALNSARRERLVIGSPSVRHRADGTKQFFRGDGRLIAVEDLAGRRLELIYEGDRLVRAVDSVGRALEFEYSDGRIARITDPLGRTWNYSYDGPRLERATDPLGRTTKYSYLPRFGWGERMSHVRFPNGADMTIFYHPLSKRVTKIEGPGAMTSRYRYSVNAPAREIRRWSWDPRGNRSESEFFGERLEPPEAEEDASGAEPEDSLAIDIRDLASLRYMANVTRTRDAEGNERVVAASASEVVAEDPKGNVTRLGKDAEGRVTTVTDPLGIATELAWDETTGKVARIELPGDRTISFEYRDGEICAITDPSGHTTRAEVIGPPAAPTGLRLIDASGTEIAVELDRHGYPRISRDAHGIESVCEFDVVGRLISFTDPAGMTSSLTYDAADNVVAARAGSGAELRIEYDEMDNPSRIVDLRGGLTTLEYDARGLLVAMTGPGGERVTYDRGRAGHLAALTWTIAGREIVHRFAYDANGRLERTIDALGRETSLRYDRAGVLKGIERPGGGEVAYRSDDAGRWTRAEHADGTVTETAYGADSLPSAVTHRGEGGSSSFTFEHDRSGRVVGVSHEGEEVRRTEYDPAGRVLSIRTPDGVIAFERDRGRILSMRSGEGASAQVWRYEYDEFGRLVATTLPTGERRAVEYDGMSRRRAVDIPGLGTIRFELDATAHITTLHLPTGGAVDATYDRAGRLETLEHRAPGGAVSHRRSYERDALGRIVAVEADEVRTEYEYDDLSRLIAAGRAGAAPERFAYDDAGNPVEIGVHRAGELAFSPGQRLAEVRGGACRHDERGNLIARGGDRYEYDASDRLTTVTLGDGSVARYAYDPLGNRVQKEVGGVITRYLHDGPHLAAELDDAGQVVARYVHAPGLDYPLAVERDGEWYFFVTDHLGTVHALRDRDGRTVESYRYTAYGAPIGELSRIHPFGFAGREYDRETGLYHCRARFYDPELGRYLSRDPGDEDGPNPYVYADGDPVSARDPLGAMPIVETAWAAARDFVPQSVTPEAMADAQNPLGFGFETAGEGMSRLATQHKAYIDAKRAAVVAPHRWAAQLSRPMTLQQYGMKSWLAEREMARLTRTAAERLNQLPTKWIERLGGPGKLASNAKLIGRASLLLTILNIGLEAYHVYSDPYSAKNWWSLIENILWTVGPYLILTFMATCPALAIIGGVIVFFLLLDSFGLIDLEAWFVALLEWLGILDADPTFIQPGGPEPPLRERPRPAIAIGAAGASRGGIRFHDATGAFLGEGGPAERLGGARFAVDPVTGVVSDVVIDIAPPAVTASIAPREGGYAVSVRSADPDLASVALHERTSTSRRELLRVAAPLPAEPLSLHLHDLGGGTRTIEAVARDRAGNESVATMQVEVPPPAERPLAIYDLSATATAAVFESEIAGDGLPPDEEGAPAAPEGPSAADIRPAWIDGALPAGATALGEWRWDPTVSFGGAPSHTAASAGDPALHYCIRAERPLELTGLHHLIQYVRLDPERPPRQILLQLYRPGERGEHRVYWGDDTIDLGGETGTASSCRLGPIPEAGRWVRLIVPVERLGLAGPEVTGILFGQAGGRAWWGTTTRSLAASDRAPEIAAVDDPAVRAAELPYEIDARLRFRATVDSEGIVRVEDAAGTTVAELIAGEIPAGRHELVWDGRGADGALVPDGEYALAIEARRGDEAPVRARTPFRVSTLVARIDLPTDRALVQATVPVFGDAAGRGFERYVVDIASSERPDEWRTIAESRRPEVSDEPDIPLDTRATIHGNLASFDVPGGDASGFIWSGSELADHHVIRLRAWDRSGEVAEDRVVVRFGHVLSNGGPVTVVSPDRRATLAVPALALRAGFQMLHLAPAAETAHGPLVTAAAAIGAEIRGEIWEIRPAGFRFERAARLELPAAAGSAGARPYVHDFASGAWRALANAAELPAEGERPPRVAADLSELPAGRCHVALLDDHGTAAPLLLHPDEIERNIELLAIAEPDATVELRDGDGATIASATASLVGLARFPGTHLRDGESRFGVVARDAAGHEAAGIRPLVIDLQPPAPTPIRSLVIVPDGDGFAIEAVADAAARRGEVLVRSESDPRGFMATVEGRDGLLRGRIAVATASAPGRATIAVSRDGERVTVSAPGATDATAEFRDRAPPAAPAITSATHPVVRLVDPPRGSPPPALHDLLAAPVDLAAHPVLGFRARIEPGSTVHLLVKTNRDWRGISLAGRRFEGSSAAGAESIGWAREFSLEDDGQWHDAALDLYAALREIDPRSERLVAESILVGEWEYTGYKEIAAIDPLERGGYEIAGAHLRRAAGGRRIEVAWETPADPSGITEYSWVLDDVPGTIPPETGKGAATAASLEAPAGEGTLHFHVRARDGAGNWGETAHFPLVADGVPPEVVERVPEDGSESWHSGIRVRLRDAGSGVDPDSLRLEVMGRAFGVRSGALAFDAKAGVASFLPWRADPPIPPWCDGQRVRVELAAAADYAGNALPAPVSWSFTLRRGAGGAGEARMLTTEGGIEPAWSPDGARIAYIAEAPARTLRIIDVASGESRALATGLAGVATPAWSPDGGSIAVAAIDEAGRSSIHRVDAASGAARLLVADASDPAWLPDGRLLLVRDGALGVLAGEEGRVEVLVADPEGARAGRPQPAADGQRVLFHRSLYDDQVWSLDLRTGEPSPLIAEVPALDPAWGRDGEILFAARATSTRLARASAAGELLGPLLAEAEWWDRCPRVSPDGSKLVLQSTRSGFWNLWLVEWLAIGALAASPERVALPESGAPAPVTISYDARGFASAELSVVAPTGETVLAIPLDAARLSAPGTVEWSALGSAGERLAAGSYTVRLSAAPPSGGMPAVRATTVTLGVGAPAAATTRALDPGTPAGAGGGLRGLVIPAGAGLAALLLLFLLLRRRARKGGTDAP